MLTDMKKQKGQTLIEALVALTIIVTVIAAISIVIVASLYNSQYVRDQNIANKYSQQGMEFVRGLQQRNITEFAAFSGSGYCINSSGDGISDSTDPFCDINNANVGNMNRVINFEKDESTCNPTPIPPGFFGANTPKLSKVTVITSWTTSKCSGGTTFCHTVTVESCLPYSTGVTP